jgi:fumarate hydratase subunit alpha
MRTIKTEKIKDAVERLFLKANIAIRPDIKKALEKAKAKETNPLAKEALDFILKNAQVAKKRQLPICQDTGLPIVFVELPQNINVVGGNLKNSIIKGVEEAYRNNLFRKSVVADPVLRRAPYNYGPPVIHIKLTRGRKIKITALAKGFGSENKNCLRMFSPAENVEEIEKFVLDCVKKAGPAACPPFIIGIGIGGTSDKAESLAKEALLFPIDKANKKRHLASLEKRIFRKINNLEIGPMGFGGKSTCLSVKILTYPTHIAGLPVAVNIGCHATRTASISI